MEKLLTNKEMKVLQALYVAGFCTASRLSKETLINRTSLYPIVEGLSKKGLVSQFIQDGVTMFEPVNHESFSLWLKHKNKEAAEHIKDLEHWLESTNSPKKPASLVSKIQYFEGFEGVKNMYADTWRNNKTKLIRAITDPKAAVHTMKDFFYGEYMPDRIARGVKVKDIMTDSKEGKEETKKSARFLREAKLAKGLFEDLGVEINIYENKLAIVSFDKRNPCAVIIENEKISSAMKDIFEYMWKKI